MLHPIPGQGMKCFKCGNEHCALECAWSGSCRHCGQEGHKALVCRRNPASIIKWEPVPLSAPTPAASSRGSVQMLAATPTQTWVPPQPYLSVPGGIPPSGYFWPPTPVAPFPVTAPSAPPAVAAPPYQGVGAPAPQHQFPMPCRQLSRWVVPMW